MRSCSSTISWPRNRTNSRRTSWAPGWPRPTRIFQRLWDEDKSAREYEFAVAALSVQMKDWTAAEALLQDLKGANYGENGVVEFYLAQVAEESGRYELAIERYRAVPEGERAWLGQ